MRNFLNISHGNTHCVSLSLFLFLCLSYVSLSLVQFFSLSLSLQQLSHLIFLFLSLSFSISLHLILSRSLSLSYSLLFSLSLSRHINFCTCERTRALTHTFVCFFLSPSFAATTSNQSVHYVMFYLSLIVTHRLSLSLSLALCVSFSFSFSISQFSLQQWYHPFSFFLSLSLSLLSLSLALGLSLACARTYTQKDRNTHRHTYMLFLSSWTTSKKCAKFTSYLTVNLAYYILNLVARSRVQIFITCLSHFFLNFLLLIRYLCVDFRVVIFFSRSYLIRSLKCCLY